MDLSGRLGYRSVSRLRRPLALAVMALGLTLPASPAHAFGGHLAFQSDPKTTGPEAVQLLNQQRAANGIPADLTEDPALSHGCWDFTNLYVPAAGEYPHEEMKSQPGYTAAGDTAASRSALASGPPDGWGRTGTPWTGAPLHLLGLFDPESTTAWYGEADTKRKVGYSACAGTSGIRQFTAPSFYSYPGGGATGVDPDGTVTGERPYAPGDAVGLPQGTEIGPNIALWAEGIDADLQSVTLLAPDGASVAVRLVTPETPAPKSPPGWPRADVMGDYIGNAAFAIPVKPLKYGSRYTLTANWVSQDLGPRTFTTSFTTAATAPQPVCETCLTGQLRAKVSSTSVRVSVSPALNQRVRIKMARGEVYCTLRARGPKGCPRTNKTVVYDASSSRAVTLHDGSTSVALPRSRTSDDRGLVVTIELRSFTARGRTWGNTTLSLSNFRDLPATSAF